MLTKTKFLIEKFIINEAESFDNVSKTFMTAIKKKIKASISQKKKIDIPGKLWVHYSVDMPFEEALPLFEEIFFKDLKLKKNGWPASPAYDYCALYKDWLEVSIWKEMKKTALIFEVIIDDSRGL